MDYTKESLERVSFQTRGKWYLAEQVDAFLDELSDSVERDAQTASQWRRERDDLRKEKERLQQERDALRQENARLKKEREEARAGEQAALTQLQAAQEKLAASPGEERRRRVCQDLEQERDQLISDIKALRSYRETCRKAVEEDARALLRQVERLPSEKLL